MPLPYNRFAKFANYRGNLLVRSTEVHRRNRHGNRQPGATLVPWVNNNFFFRKVGKKFIFYENFSLLLGKLMVRYPGWLWPDVITMPVAQFWEKAVFSTPPTLYLAPGKYFERWNTQ